MNTHISKKSMSLARRFLHLSLVSACFLPALAMADQSADMIYKTALGTSAEIQALIAQGASVDTVDEKGTPIINIAASRSDASALEIVKMLIQSGADINSRDARRQTPLMHAIAVQNVEMVHFLLSNGADFYAADLDGKTIQKQAEWMGNAQIRGLIDEAMKQDAERNANSNSRERMYQLLDEFIYYSCASQYLVQAQAVDALGDMDNETYNEKYVKLQTTVSNAQFELEYTFKMDRGELEEMSKKSRELLADELVVYSTKKAALRKGIGTDGDLDKRCRSQLEKWREGFAQSEDKRMRKEEVERQKAQKKANDLQLKAYMESEHKRREQLNRQRYEEYHRKAQDAKGLAVPEPE